jgi:hypothetical protein
MTTLFTYSGERLGKLSYEASCLLDSLGADVFVNHPLVSEG